MEQEICNTFCDEGYYTILTLFPWPLKRFTLNLNVEPIWLDILKRPHDGVGNSL